MVIKTIEQLRKLATDTVFSGYIVLNGGLRSSKDIQVNGMGHWNVFNLIDDSETDYGTESEFVKGEPHIMKAMKNGVFYAWED